MTLGGGGFSHVHYRRPFSSRNLAIVMATSRASSLDMRLAARA